MMQIKLKNRILTWALLGVFGMLCVGLYAPMLHHHLHEHTNVAHGIQVSNWSTPSVPCKDARAGEDSCALCIVLHYFPLHHSKPDKPVLAPRVIQASLLFPDSRVVTPGSHFLFSTRAPPQLF